VKGKRREEWITAAPWPLPFPSFLSPLQPLNYREEKVCSIPEEGKEGRERRTLMPDTSLHVPSEEAFFNSRITEERGARRQYSSSERGAPQGERKKVHSPTVHF